MAAALNWVANFVVSLASLPLAGAIGQGETFWIVGGICVIAFFFTSRYLPETRNRDPEQIEVALQSRFGHKHGRQRTKAL